MQKDLCEGHRLYRGSRVAAIGIWRPLQVHFDGRFWGAVNVTIPQLLPALDVALLLLRLMVAAVFLTSGYHHLKDPKGRAESIGTSPAFTAVLGAGETLGSLGVATGVLVQPAAIGLILIMLGAIQKKIFVWKTGFWGEKASGWHYDLMLALMTFVILCSAGGRLVIGL
jgi:putative oxidoreductase